MLPNFRVVILLVALGCCCCFQRVGRSLSANLPFNLALKASKNNEGSSSKGGENANKETSFERRRMSWPLSFVEAPDYLDGALAGDAGFDPIGVVPLFSMLAAPFSGIVSTNSNRGRSSTFDREEAREVVYTLREAEIKHARIAMLAALGWPVSELYHYQLSQKIGLDDLLADGGRAPSVLNGGLDNLYVLLALGTVFAVGGVLEFELARRRKEAPEALQNFYEMWREEGWDLPGNYGFDPLKLKEKVFKDEDSRMFIQTIEIFNGRFAMLATVGFAVQEFTTGLPIVRETPEFFNFPSF